MRYIFKICPLESAPCYVPPSVCIFPYLLRSPTGLITIISSCEELLSFTVEYLYLRSQVTSDLFYPSPYYLKGNNSFSELWVDFKYFFVFCQLFGIFRSKFINACLDAYAFGNEKKLFETEHL